MDINGYDMSLFPKKKQVVVLHSAPSEGQETTPNMPKVWN